MNNVDIKVKELNRDEPPYAEASLEFKIYGTHQEVEQIQKAILDFLPRLTYYSPR